MTVDTDLRLRDGTGIPSQFGAVLLGPLAVLVGLQLAYMSVHPACHTGDLTRIHLSLLATIAVAGCGLLLALRLRRRWGAGHGEGEGGPARRSRFMAVVGTVVSSLSVMVLAALWTATLFLGPCA